MEMKLRKIKRLDCLKCLQSLCIPMCACLGGKRAGRQAGLGRGYVNTSVVSQNLGICMCVSVECLGWYKLFFFFNSPYTFLFCLNVFMDVDS